MKREMIPGWDELARHARIVPEINPAAVIAMLGIKQAAEDIQSTIMDVLTKKHHLSEGKFCALVVLHQHMEGIAPSALASKVGVTRATVSVMLQRMEREGLVRIRSDEQDGRGKRVFLTEKGREFMNDILPAHYLRITELMGKLTEEEQEELGRLLKKLSGDAAPGERLHALA